MSFENRFWIHYDHCHHITWPSQWSCMGTFKWSRHYCNVTTALTWEKSPDGFIFYHLETHHTTAVMMALTKEFLNDNYVRISMRFYFKVTHGDSSQSMSHDDLSLKWPNQSKNKTNERCKISLHWSNSDTCDHLSRHADFTSTDCSVRVVPIIYTCYL